MIPTFQLENDNYKLEVHPVGSYQQNSSWLTNKKSNEVIIFDIGLDIEKVTTLLKNKKPVGFYHTHAHFDHIGALGHFKRKYKTSLSYLPKDELIIFEWLDKQKSMFNVDMPDKEPIDILIEKEGIVENRIGTEMSIQFTPGHSPGSSCYYFKDTFDVPLLIGGDTIFANSIGRTDLLGGDFDTIINSIKTKILTLPDETLIITGHGPTTTVGEERNNNPFLNK